MIISPIKVFFDKSYEYLFKNKADDQQIIRYYDKQNLKKKIYSFFSEATHVIDNIYLGNARNAADFFYLSSNNFGLIINVTNEISIYYPDNFKYLNYKINDNNLDEIKEYLEDSYEKINKYKSLFPNKKILIHCFMGSSRSASIIIYYIMKKYPNKFSNTTKSISYLKEKRNIVNPTHKLVNDIIETI